MPRQRLTSWLPAIGSKQAEASAHAMRPDAVEMLDTLRRNPPGQWSQKLGELAKHMTGPVFLAVNTLMTQAYGASFEVYERTETETSPRGKVKLPWHDPIHSVFERPNEQDGFGELLEQCVQQISLTGISLTWAVPNDAEDEPTELYSIPSATAWPMPPNWEYPFGAYRILPYPYGVAGYAAGLSLAGAVIPAEQIKVAKKPHPLLRYDGYAILTAIASHVDTVEAIDKSRNYSMQKGPQQTVAMEFPDDANFDEDAIKRYRLQLKSLYGGPANAGEFLIAYGGARFRQVSTAPSDMAWREGWDQIVDFILACYGVPRSVAGMQQDTSYATLYASLRAFVILSLGPLLDRFANTWTRHLIQPAYGREFGMLIRPKEFKDESLLEQQLGTDLKAGAILIEELRDLRGRDKLDPAKYSWVGDRASQNYQLPQGDGGPPEGGSNPDAESGESVSDTATDRGRPKSPGDKSLTNGHRREQLLKAFERAKTNGTAKPIKR